MILPRLAIFGLNKVEIIEKSSAQILIDEVLHPFFVFQIASIILWSLDNYYYYATCIFLISLSSTIATFFETKSNIRRMQNLSRFSCKVNLWRNKTWKLLDSSEIIPGDLFEIDLDASAVFPCDAVLLTGDCIVNESNSLFD